MPLIDLNLGRLGNPIADGLNQIQAANERRKTQDMERAKMLMQQQNQDADNQRADSFLKLQQDQFSRTGANEEEAKKRQGADDYQKIYSASGHDPAMARQLAKAYGYEIVDSPNGPVAVQKSQPASPGLSDGLMTPAGMGSDNGTPQASMMPISPPPQPNPGVGGGGPFFAGPPQLQPGQAAPGGEAPPLMEPGAPPPMATPIAPPAPPQPTEAQITAKADQLNPILAAFHMRKGGQEFSVDPNAAKAEEERSFADQLKLKQAAPDARMAAAAIEAEKARAFKEAEDAKYRNQGQTVQDRRDLANIAANGRVRAAGVSAMSPLRADSGNRQDMGTLRQAFKDWRTENTLDVDSKTNRRLSTALSNIDSGNSMQQKEAAESLVSIFKGGGQVTKASQDLLLKHLGGLVADAQSWLQGLQNGQYGSRELNILKQAAHGAMEEQQQRLGTAYKSAVEAFGPGSGFENLGGNVNHAIKGEFKQFGLDVPDIYQQESAPKVTLGSGSRPKPQKTNPIVNARVPKDDKSAVDMAKARLAKDPNDKVARRVLEQLGAAN